MVDVDFRPLKGGIDVKESLHPHTTSDLVIKLIMDPMLLPKGKLVGEVCVCPSCSHLKAEFTSIAS